MLTFTNQGSLDKLNYALRMQRLDEDDAKFTHDPKTDRFVLWMSDWENGFGDDMVVIKQFKSFQKAWNYIGDC
jgi:hypothetical protein